MRMNTDFSIQYMWRPTRGVLSSSWTDEFEYTTLSCDGDKVQAKVIVNVHKICAAGQWTKAVGTKTTGTKCVNCDVGTWRQVAASSSAFAENKAAVCKPHKTCSAGQWTKAVGTKSTDTKCVGCDVVEGLGLVRHRWTVGEVPLQRGGERRREGRYTTLGAKDNRAAET